MPPSELAGVYWRMTFRDLTTVTTLKMGFEQARAAAELASLAEVASALFGGKPSRPEPARSSPAADPPPSSFPQTEEQLRATLAPFLRMG